MAITCVYYTQLQGVTALGKKHINPPKLHHYAHLNDICTFSKYLDHGSGFYDDYNPLYTAATILNGVCKECGKWFPTKKLLTQHRRAVQPRSTEDNMKQILFDNRDSDVNKLLLPREIQFYNDISSVIDHRDGKYLVQLHNGMESWVILSDEHPKVVEYLEQEDQKEEVEEEEDQDIDLQTPNVEKMPFITNLSDWNKQDFITLDGTFRDCEYEDV